MPDWHATAARAALSKKAMPPPGAFKRHFDWRRRSSAWRHPAIIFAALFSLWAVSALYIDIANRTVNHWFRIPIVILYSAFLLKLAFGTQRGWKEIFVWMGSLCLVLAWWFSLRPTNDRPWQPDVAQLASVVRDGDRVTIQNVRNFDYRTETDYTAHWETRTVDLSQIRGADLFLTHFGSPWIAHAIVSFRFGTGSASDTFLAMSIEQRKAVGQTYSTLRGFFRQYELIYLVADERDVVRLRTDYRSGEYVRLYHTLLTPEDSRTLFLRYLRWIENIRNEPQWYNALTDNCTTSVTSYLEHRHVGGLSRWDWRNIFNGRGDEMLYDDGDLATGGLPFPELAKQAEINDAARRLGNDPDFSEDIRKGHPGF